jgi:hypothetical protein
VIRSEIIVEIPDQKADSQTCSVTLLPLILLIRLHGGHHVIARHIVVTGAAVIAAIAVLSAAPAARQAPAPQDAFWWDLLQSGQPPVKIEPLR